MKTYVKHCRLLLIPILCLLLGFCPACRKSEKPLVPAPRAAPETSCPSVPEQAEAESPPLPPGPTEAVPFVRAEEAVPGQAGTGLTSGGQAVPAAPAAAPAAGASPSAIQVPQGVWRLAGTPEEIGTQHGTQLKDKMKIMLSEYVEGDLTPAYKKGLQGMKAVLPDWYKKELAACAATSGVDEDLLLFAQCEGDVKSAFFCTSYVAFGPSTADGTVEIGRNFDYWGIESSAKVVVILAIIPRPGDGYAFVSVGWAGILGGWTFFNEKGLFISNNLGGPADSNKTDPKGIPTLILERIIAQKAATVDEAVALLKKLPRMRRQALVIGQTGEKPDAAVVKYDSAVVEVERHKNGWAFHTSVGTSAALLKTCLLKPDRRPTEAIHSAGCGITLHSAAIRPDENKIWVAHGLKPRAHEGTYIEYDLAQVLKR